MSEPGLIVGLVGRLIDLVGKVSGRRAAHRQACFEQRRVEEQLKESIAELVPLLE